jgi:hypothetical protein
MGAVTLSRAQAIAQLVTLGFSQRDAERMTQLNPVDRAVGGQIASGLTTESEVLVHYRAGTYRYVIEARRRPPGPAPCMWRQDYEAASDRFAQAEEALGKAHLALEAAQAEFEAAEAWLRLHEERPGIPLPQCRPYSRQGG